MDVACGTGVVGKELRQAGYDNIDGLDPSQGYLQEAVAQGIFRKVFRAFIDPEKPTEIPNDTYDALLCCAGFFQVNFTFSMLSTSYYIKPGVKFLLVGGLKILHRCWLLVVFPKN